MNLQGTAKFDDMLNVSHFYEASKAVGGRGGSRLHFHGVLPTILLRDAAVARLYRGKLLPLLPWS